MGATCDEVITDYMTTYYNYYGVEKGTAGSGSTARSASDDKYEAIANSNIIKILCDAFQLSDTSGLGLSNAELLAQADLAAEAEEYIQSLGLTDAEIAQLKTNLGAAAESENSAPGGESSSTDESSNVEDSSGSSSGTPDTGDHSNAASYAVTAILALVALTVLIQSKKQYRM